MWRLVAAELAGKHERYACRRLPRRSRPARPAGAIVCPQLAEVSERLRPAHRVARSSRCRASCRRALLRRAGRPALPVDAVHPPPLRALLHTRARRHPRGRRSRQRPGRASGSPRCTRRPGGRRRRADHAGGVRLLQPGVLVHPRVRRGVGGQRPAHLRGRPAVVLRRARRLPPRRAAPVRRRRHGEPAPTTSRSTSRCCSPPARSTRSTTGSARSSTATATRPSSGSPVEQPPDRRHPASRKRASIPSGTGRAAPRRRR